MQSRSVFIYVGINLLIRNDTANEWWTWFSPCSDVMWITIIILMALLTIAFIVLDYIDPNRMGKRMFDFFASYWYVFGSFTQSSVELMPGTPSVKIMSMLMWFSIIILIASYTAAYSSYLLMHEPFAFVENVQSAFAFYQSYNYPFYFINKSLSSQYLRTHFSTAYANAMSNPSSYLVDNVYHAAAALLKQSTSSAFLGDARMNQWMSNEVNCWLVTVGDIDGLGTSFFSTIALPPNSTYYSEIQLELINLERFRVLPTMKHFYFDSQCPTTVIPQPLSLQQLAGLYIVLGAGTALSFLTVCCTLVYKKMQLRAARFSTERQQSFHFNKIYLALVVAVDDRGILIKVYRQSKDLERDLETKYLEHPPYQYFMQLVDLNVGNKKNKKPRELQLHENCRILVRYLGINPSTDSDRFIFAKNLDKQNDVDEEPQEA